MQVTNDSYDDKLRRYEWLLRHSKTWQALGLDKQENFDAELENASSTGTTQQESGSEPENTSVVRMDQTSDIRQGQKPEHASQYSSQPYSDLELYMRWHSPLSNGRDILIAEEAERHAQSMDISGRKDTAIAAPVQRADTGRDSLLSAAEKYMRSRFPIKRDTLLVKAAETHAQSMNISGRRDTAIIAPEAKVNTEHDTLLPAAEKYMRSQFPIKQDVLLAGASESYVRKMDAALHPDYSDKVPEHDGHDPLLIEAAQKYLRSMHTEEPDTCLAETAEMYAQAKDISGSHDTIFAAMV